MRKDLSIPGYVYYHIESLAEMQNIMKGPFDPDKIGWSGPHESAKRVFPRDWTKLMTEFEGRMRTLNIEIHE